MFFYIKCSLNVQFSQLIMTLHNTFHAWIPCENSSHWIYCVASPLRWNGRATVSTGESILPLYYIYCPEMAFGFVLFIVKTGHCVWFHVSTPSCKHTHTTREHFTSCYISSRLANTKRCRKTWQLVRKKKKKAKMSLDEQNKTTYEQE